jgi:hypothetical protein
MLLNLVIHTTRGGVVINNDNTTANCYYLSQYVNMYNKWKYDEMKYFYRKIPNQQFIHE